METEIERLQKLLKEKEEIIDRLIVKSKSKTIPEPNVTQHCKRLQNDEILRYGRQIILPELGVAGQIKLKNSKILVVGAGGLGCPACIYLAAAGVGKLGIVDYDCVELSNLQRQILHTEAKINVEKSSSAAHACYQLNSAVECVPYHIALNSENAIDLINQYDIVLDATDNVATRYLLNDACVLTGKPLVSGSALRFEGQLTVYNDGKGPCYRCLYPEPPPPETVTNCSDGGVLGVVPGIIGSIQALEALKIASGMHSSYSGKMLLFDAIQGTFRSIRLREKQVCCKVCSENAEIKHLIDYEQFCGAKATDKTKSVSILEDESRISVQDYRSMLSTGTPHILIDVRQPVEMEICHIENSINIPINEIEREDSVAKVKQLIEDKVPLSIFVVCRLGNDSQKAAVKLKHLLSCSPVTIKDIKGGLTAWAKHVDQSFPIY